MQIDSYRNKFDKELIFATDYETDHFETKFYPTDNFDFASEQKKVTHLPWVNLA